MTHSSLHNFNKYYLPSACKLLVEDILGVSERAKKGYIQMRKARVRRNKREGKESQKEE